MRPADSLERKSGRASVNPALSLTTVWPQYNISIIQGGSEVTAHTRPFNNSRYFCFCCTEISEIID